MNGHEASVSGNGVVGAESSGVLGSGVSGKWEQVTDKKKQRRVEAKDKKGAGSEKGSASNGDQSVFAALDASEARRLKEKKAREAEAAITGVNVDSSDEDADGYAAAEGGAPGQGEAKPKVKKEKKPKVLAADVAAKIDPDELSSFLIEIKANFPDNVDVQLMRLADYFARAFAAVTTATFQWQKILRENPLAKSAEVPLSFIPPPVIKVASDWLAKQPLAELSKFALLLLKAVVEDVPGATKSQKAVAAQSTAGKAQVGVLAVLATLLRRKPDALLAHAEELRTNALYKGQEQLPSVVWAYSQVALGDLASGMWLWARNLLPVAVAKGASPATRDLALQFVESFVLANQKKARGVLMSSAAKKSGERLVTPAAFELVMRAAFPSEAARTKATDRWVAAYPLVRDLALAGSGKGTKTVATALLPLVLSAAGEGNGELAREACSALVWCLGQNTECFHQWEKAHLAQLSSSTALLAHLLHHWVESAPLLASSQVELAKTIKALRQKHQPLLESTQEGGDMPTVRAADQHCKALERKLSRFSMGGCLTIAALAAVGVALAMAFLPIVETVA